MVEPAATLPPDAARPLSGQRVLVTRAETSDDPLAEALGRLGATVLSQPAIRIGPPADWQPVDDALGRLHQFDWLVFSSVNGVRSFLERSAARKLDKPWPRIAAIGPGTAAALREFGLEASLVPNEFHAEALAGALTPNAAGCRFLLARASRGRDLLAQELLRAGAQVEQVVVYTSTDVEEPEPEIAAMLAAGQIDWITVTSSAIARSLDRLFGHELQRAKLASISPLTSGVLRELGHRPTAEAQQSTLPGVAAAIARHASHRA
ncbi:MAG: uroporphyrinogen-III synthase [Thermoguttaceae bacterium]